MRWMTWRAISARTYPEARDAAMNFLSMLRRSRAYATGGTCDGERWQGLTLAHFRAQLRTFGAHRSRQSSTRAPSARIHGLIWVRCETK
jgi:hypothetical protein